MTAASSARTATPTGWLLGGPGDVLDVIASQPHYRAHLDPIVDAIGPVYVHDLEDVTLVASHRDLVTARKAGAERIVLAQHGAGQSYGGDPASARNPAYPGGEDNAAVGLFLVPNEHAAQRWQDAYPDASVRIVGCPRLDTLPRKTIDPLDDHPVVALSFHWDALTVPEMRSAYTHFRSVVPDLAERYKILGHAHPRRQELRRWYQRLGIEWVPDFDEVCRRADLYVCDNSSTIFEFAATGRPVLLLNAPWYRREVEHGLRFWNTDCVGQSVRDPGDLVDAVEDALRDGWRFPRDAAVDYVYTYRDGAARRAADAILEWAA